MGRTLLTCSIAFGLSMVPVSPWAWQQERQSPERSAADARRAHGVRLYKDARFAAARAELEAALSLYEAIGDRAGAGWTLHHLGWAVDAEQSRQAADVYWRRGIAEMQAAGDRRGEAQLTHDHASAVSVAGGKIAVLQRALQLAREAGDPHIEAAVLYSSGQQQFYDGDYAGALETLQDVLARFERLRADDRVAETLVTLGTLHLRHGDPDRARGLYTRAIAMLQRLGDKDDLAQAMGTLASLHRASGRLDEAVAAARQALALRLTMGGLRQINLERLRLAWIYIDFGQYRRAKTLIDEVLRGDDAFSKSLAHAPLAEVQLALGAHAEAVESADLALRLLREPAERVFILATRARAEDKLGNPDRALADIDEALRAVEEVRKRLVPTDSMKLGHADRLQALFQFAIDLRMRLGQPRAALEAAEQSRARAFLDLLATRDRIGRPGELRDNAIVSAAVATPASADQLVEVARRLDSALLIYWVSRSRTIVWVVRGDGAVNAASVDVQASRLAALIGRTSVDPGFVHSAPRQPWRELHDLLVAPVVAHLPPAEGSLVTVVPHGPLFRLPFAGLLDERGRYLLERYRLHYVPSGGTPLYIRARVPAGDGPARYLLVANPAVPARDGSPGLPQLPGALREVSGIANGLPAGVPLVLTGAQASEATVRASLRGASVVHLATHAVLNDDRPFESFLALAGRGADSTTDGRLTAGDVYGLALDADLVVLSACRSARGRVTGDGVLGMTRAFIYAGASSVIASLWDVADEPTAELMRSFYRAWRDGATKTAALRAAQLRLLARLRAGQLTVRTPAGETTLPEHPFFWAGFGLAGHP